MSVLGHLFERKVLDASALSWSALASDYVSKTGVTVTRDLALRVSAAYACCRVLTEDVGKLPLKLVREHGDVVEVAREHPLHRVLSRRPNEWQTSMEWRMTMLLHALLGTGGYSYINRNAAGEVLELVPLLPNRVTVRQSKTWEVSYDVRDGGGATVARLPRSSVHAIHGMSWDGVTGLDVITHGREALGLSAATEESQARLHGNGVRPGGLLSTTSVLTKEQVARVREQFASAYGGVGNAFKTLLLDNGLKFEPWTMAGVDAQHLETRRFQVEDICRFFRVFPSMVGFSDKAATYASAESFFGAHVVHSIQPWVTMWEQALERDVLTEKERAGGYGVKFMLQGLLRGDQAARAAFYESAITRAGWMTRNEARKLEDLNPLPGLDNLVQPAGTGPAGAEKPTVPNAAAEESDDGDD